MSDLENLLIDLRTLVRSTKEDYQNKCWTTYPNHIAEFNRILLLTEKMGLVSGLEPIQSVPLEKLTFGKVIGRGTQAEQAKLRELVDKSERLVSRLLSFCGETEKADKATEPVTILERICSRFHLVVRQLRNRREGRKTLEVEDEYDAQDLLHSLLWLFFEDIRPEEWTPSYAGASSRMDFLLKKEKMVIEIKKTRNGLGDKEIGEQLLTLLRQINGIC